MSQAVARIPSEFNFHSRDVLIGSSVFKNHGLKWLNANPMSRTEVFPTVFQNSLGYRNFKLSMLKVFEELDQDVPFIDHSEMQAFKTDMDAPSSLAPIAPENCYDWRQKYKCREPSKEDLDIAKQLISLIASNAELEPVLHRDVSSSGAPFFITGTLFKKLCSDRTYSSKNVSRFLNMNKYLKERNFRELVKMELYPLFTQGERKHFVKPNKQRLFINPESFLEGKVEWEEVSFKHPYDQVLHCYDRRSMYALNNELNINNQILNNALMNGFKKVCKGVDYKGEVELSQEIQELKGKRVLFSLDKSKFGETMSPDVIKVVFEVLKTTKFCKLAENAEALMACPVYYRNLRTKNKISLLTYDPSNGLNKYHSQSFKSGHGLVAFFGKFLGVLDTVLMFKSILDKGRIPFDLEKVLKNEYTDMWFKNSGDDTIISLSNMYYKVFNTEKSLHVDNIEEQCVFLGYYYSQLGKPIVSLGRFLLNRFLPERSFRVKSCPKIGFIAAYELYKNLAGNHVDNLRFLVNESNRLLERHTGFRLQSWLDKPDSVEKEYLDLVRSDSDLLFLTNPDIVHYKVDVKFVSEDLRNRFYKTTEVETIKHLLELT